MTENSTKDFLSDLYDEFEQETNDLRIKYDENVARLDIIDSTIAEIQRNNDESSMFSPREIDDKDSERVNILLMEKKDIEEENIVITNQLKYYENKSDSINKVVSDMENKGNSSVSRSGKENKIDSDHDLLKNQIILNKNVEDNNRIIITENDDDFSYSFSKQEYKSLISRLETISDLVDSNLTKAKINISSLLYDLRHR
ncbi:MAG: hypothetical protein K6B28_13045 [Lachnospiraceae bacterium]|nr:hypothetical protein [Lachnospiraceae bacterium]